MVNKNDILKTICKTNPIAPYILKRCEFEISGKVSYCRFNPKKNSYLINLAVEHTKSLLMATLVGQHEMLHIIFRSHYYAGSGYNHRLQNIAQDAIINQYLIEHNTDYVEVLNELKGITLDLINTTYKTSFVLKDTTWQDVYKVLKDNGEDKYGCIDEHPDSSPSEGETDVSSSIVEKIAKDASFDKSVAGSGEALGIIAKVSQNEKAKKNAALVKKINNFLSFNKSFDYKRTIKRPNKRVPGYPFGRTKKHKPKFLVAIDNSGSMACATKEMGISITTALKIGYSVDIVWGSDKEYGFEENATKVPEIPVGGGCNNDVGFFNRRLKNYDCVLVVTDAIALDPELDKNKTLFILTQKSKWVEDKYKYVLASTLE